MAKSKSSSLLPRPVTAHESSERLRDTHQTAMPSSGVKKQTGITPIISRVGQIMIEKTQDLPEIVLEPETHKKSPIAIVPKVEKGMENFRKIRV